MKEQPGYQKDLSRQSPILLDSRYKQPKIDKMLAILKNAGVISDERKNLVALDVGCSKGLFTSAFANYFENVIGIDIDTHAMPMAQKENDLENVHFSYADSLNLPFRNDSIDLILCNHVYEHVPVPEKLFSEIHRVLKPDGVCYLGAASRLTLVEPHYHLLFLSWLPKPVAHWYMRITGKGTHYYEMLRTYWGIRGLIKEFDVEDYTLRVIEHPDKYKARDMIPEGGILGKVPQFIWRLLYYFLPSYILILSKQPASSSDEIS
ncbi:MAG: class I SAM-dependent methyltransferase [Candidatus Scalindua sp.]